MATIDGVDKDCAHILYRVNGHSLQPGISGMTMTTTPFRTSTAIRRALFAGTSLPRRTYWRRERERERDTRCFGIVSFSGHIKFLFSLTRCWQSHAAPCRWFFANISRGMHLVALRQPAEWFRSQSRINLRQPAEWSWSQKRIYLRQLIELSRYQSRVDILTFPCMLTQHW